MSRLGILTALLVAGCAATPSVPPLPAVTRPPELIELRHFFASLGGRSSGALKSAR